MPEKTSLSLNGIGLTSPNRDVVAGTAKVANADIAPNGLEMFSRTVTITALAAGTAIPILTDAEVGTGRKVYVVDVFGCNTGATAWSGGSFTSMSVQDTNGSPVSFFTIAVAGITNAARLFRQSSGITVQSAMVQMTGGTAGKGISLVGNANAGAGTDVVLTIQGFIG